MSGGEAHDDDQVDLIDTGTLRMSITGFALLDLPPILLLKLSRGLPMVIVVLVLEAIIWNYWWRHWGMHWLRPKQWAERQRGRAAGPP